MIRAVFASVVALATSSSAVEDRSEWGPYAETVTLSFSDLEKRDEELGPHATKRIVHVKRGEIVRDDVRVVLEPAGTDLAGEARFTTAWQSGHRPFRDLLLSWNVDTAPSAGFVVELRVAAKQDDWSPWMTVGDWGVVPTLPQVTECVGGRIDTDFFRGDQTFERAQVRVRGFAAADATAREIVVRRLTLCFSDRTLVVDPREGEGCPMPGPTSEDWKQPLRVPFRSQRAEDPNISSRICSPTSLAMVLDYRGVTAKTVDVAARTFDAAHGIYGNWPRNIQAAYSYGIPGCLTRFTNWKAVEGTLAMGQPIIASIGVKKGQLRGAPYEETTGHLIVLTGFDDAGNVFVNDPAASAAATGQVKYSRRDLQVVWLDRGGTAYVLLEKP